MRCNAFLSSLLALSVTAFAATTQAATITTLNNPTTWRVTISGVKHDPSNYSKCANLSAATMWNKYYWCPVSVGTLSAAEVTKINSTTTTAPTTSTKPTTTFSVITLVNPTTWRVTLSDVKYEPSNYSKCADTSAAKLWDGYYWCPVSVGVLDAAKVAALTGSTSGSTSGGTTAPTAPTTYTAKLSWSAPSTRADGTPLTMSELKGYEIYYTNDALSQSVTLPVSGGSINNYSVPNLKAGTYHFAISAIDSKGLKSALSSMVSTSFK